MISHTFTIFIYLHTHTTPSSSSKHHLLHSKHPYTNIICTSTHPHIHNNLHKHHLSTHTHLLHIYTAYFFFFASSYERYLHTSPSSKHHLLHSKHLYTNIICTSTQNIYTSIYRPLKFKLFPWTNIDATSTAQ